MMNKINGMLNKNFKMSFEEKILSYVNNLDWQRQDELISKINNVLVNQIFEIEKEVLK